MVLSEFGKDFAIESDIGLLKHWYKAGVRKAFGLEESVHADLPESAEVTLLVLPVSESVGTSVSQSLLSLAFLLRAAEAVALGLAEHVSSGFEGVNAFLNSGHGGLLNVYEEASSLLHRHVEFGGAVLGGLVVSALLGVEMVLA